MCDSQEGMFDECIMYYITEFLVLVDSFCVMHKSLIISPYEFI